MNAAKAEMSNVPAVHCWNHIFQLGHATMAEKAWSTLHHKTFLFTRKRYIFKLFQKSSKSNSYIHVHCFYNVLPVYYIPQYHYQQLYLKEGMFGVYILSPALYMKK